MRIGEIAELTGLSISNIRFYEKKGLIGPDREADSKYRNYTDDDLKRLNLIILYRKMELPVETISKILSGKVTAEDALEQQLLDLKEKQQQLISSIDLCEKVINDRAYDEMDVSGYLSYVKEEEAKGKVFGQIDEFLDDFSSMTNFDGLGLWMLPKYWMYRLATLAWMILIVFMPLVAVIIDCVEDKSVHYYYLIFAVAWTVVWGFVIRKILKKNDQQ